MHSMAFDARRIQRRPVRLGVLIMIAILVGGWLGAGRFSSTSAAGPDIRINACGGMLDVGGVVWSQCYGVNACSGWASNGYMTIPGDPAPVIATAAKDLGY